MHLSVKPHDKTVTWQDGLSELLGPSALPSRLLVAMLLAFGAQAVAYADEGDDTLGVAFLGGGPGNVVSYTNTIESSHGIGTFSGYFRGDGSFRNHGFLLNNELTDFNTPAMSNPVTGEIGYNDVQPGKRPRSSMTPTMPFTPDRKLFAAYGSPGGATIINSVINVTMNLIDHKMGLQDAIDAGRISVTGVTSSLTLENRSPTATI